MRQINLAWQKKISKIQSSVEKEKEKQEAEVYTKHENICKTQKYKTVYE